MSESHMHYYPDHGSTLPEYLQESIPDVEESYDMSYEQSATSANGHEDGDASSSHSESSVPVDNASIISHSTSQTKTQQVKTVTKIIKTRQIHHLGPDGKPINFSQFAGQLPPDSDYMPYNYTQNPANDYSAYDPGRPPSPAGQTPHVYSHERDYGTYGRTGTSPASTARNFNVYSPQTGEPYSEYGYRDYPESSMGTTPSGSSDSPNLHRAMPQAPRTATDYNHQPCNYEDIDAAALAVPHRIDYHPRTPSPTQSTDRYGYGYTGKGPATSPGYHQYDQSLPQGYLDRRPSYDDHPQTRLPQGGPHPSNAAYARVTRPGFEEEPLNVVGGVSRESDVHPIPPRHPHAHLEYSPEDSQVGGTGDRWRDPDLHEVIDFLCHPSNVIISNAAAYLQHLSYMDDLTKQKVRSLGGIPPLIDLLNHDIPEIQRNACGALRNLSYGRKNEENKRAIHAADGIPALVRLLRKTPDNEIRELITGIIWNLSSCEDLKCPIIDDALAVLVNHVIIPHSGWNRSNPLGDDIKTTDIYFPTVFRNASGVLRNISSAGEYARKKLRACDGLIESMVYLVRAAIGRNEIDNKSVENCVCCLRNLSYRCEEVEDPHYDKHAHAPCPPFQSAHKGNAPTPIRAVGENLGCFGANRKKKDAAEAADKDRREGILLTKNPISNPEPVRGMALLWQPEVAQCYLSLLVDCSNPETLEASAGAIQNLAACYDYQPSIDIRAFIRKEKGLPILVELLRIEKDRIVCTIARALRNMCCDPRNKDLIGNYAMKDLVHKLPNGSPNHDAGTSDDTIAAVLATLNEVVAKHSDFARSFLQLAGIERLKQITEQKESYSPRVYKFASELLFNMWSHQDLREAIRKSGYKESHFNIPKSLQVRNLSSPTGPNSTINRPVSSKSCTKYEDRTLPHTHGTDLNAFNVSIPSSRSEELPLSELSHSTEPPPPPSEVHRSHVGFPPMQQARPPTEPVYAQVKKKGRVRHSDIPVQLLSSEQPEDVPAGDSWV